jgi:hypothetical protein
MSTDNTAAELVAILRRAEQREREATRQKAAEALGDLFEQDRQRQIASFRSNSGTARDRLRSETDKLRHNELETARLIGELSDDEEAEYADLTSRREPSGYYRPAADAGDDE